MSYDNKNPSVEFLKKHKAPGYEGFIGFINQPWYCGYFYLIAMQKPSAKAPDYEIRTQGDLYLGNAWLKQPKDVAKLPFFSVKFVTEDMEKDKKTNMVKGINCKALPEGPDGHYKVVWSSLYSVEGEQGDFTATAHIFSGVSPVTPQVAHVGGSY